MKIIKYDVKLDVEKLMDSLKLDLDKSINSNFIEGTYVKDITMNNLRSIINSELFTLTITLNWTWVNSDTMQ